MKKTKGLTAKQKLFCEEYLKDLNAAAAAVRAGYKHTINNKIGNRLLQEPAIKEFVGASNNRRMNKVQVSAERVLEELVRVAFADIGEIYGTDGKVLPIPDIPEGIRRAIAGVEVTTLFAEGVDIGEKQKIRLTDKIRALELLGKHLSLFNERTKYFINGQEFTPEQVVEEYAKKLAEDAK